MEEKKKNEPIDGYKVKNKFLKEGPNLKERIALANYRMEICRKKKESVI